MAASLSTLWLTPGIKCPQVLAIYVLFPWRPLQGTQLVYEQVDIRARRFGTCLLVVFTKFLGVLSRIVEFLKR